MFAFHHCLLSVSIVYFSFSSAQVTDDGCYLIVKVYRGAEPKNHLYFYDLSNGVTSNIPLSNIITEFEASYDVIGLVWYDVMLLLYIE